MIEEIKELNEKYLEEYLSELGEDKIQEIVDFFHHLNDNWGNRAICLKNGFVSDGNPEIGKKVSLIVDRDRHGHLVRMDKVDGSNSEFLNNQKTVFAYKDFLLDEIPDEWLDAFFIKLKIRLESEFQTE